MSQWLKMRARYLHLLLENEGLTRALTCTKCSNPMEVKCSDCFGGNYFCKPCSIESHKCTPFHRMACWMGTHFAPVTLHSLGFVLFLGHHGAPCPLTVEVCHIHLFSSSMITHCLQGIQASKKVQPKAQSTRRTWSTSLKPVSEERAPHPDEPLAPLSPSHDSKDIQGLSTTLFEPLVNQYTKHSHRVRTAQSGNPLITAVHQSGIFSMEILYCICPNAVGKDEQLFNAGLFPSTFKQIETAFTFAVLDDFLTDNLECKTTAQQYYSKLQSITNRMFPDNVPVSLPPFLMRCMQ
jgi:hypothetical protein